MQQRKRIPLPVKFRAPDLLESHMPIKRDSLRILLIHVLFVRAELCDGVFKQQFPDTLPAARIIHKQHFNAVIIHPLKAVNNACVIAGYHDLEVGQVRGEQ